MEDNGGGSKGAVVAYVGDEADTCTRQPQEVHLEEGGADPAAVVSEEEGMGTLQPRVNVHMIGELGDDEHMAGDDDDVTWLLDYRDRLAIEPQASAVGLVRCPLTASYSLAPKRPK